MQSNNINTNADTNMNSNNNTNIDTNNKEQYPAFFPQHLFNLPQSISQPKPNYNNKNNKNNKNNYSKPHFRPNSRYTHLKMFMPR